ncbi:MAG: hypothetical protein WC326_13325 [Candidatus Delongbacteria bacterium]
MRSLIVLLLLAGATGGARGELWLGLEEAGLSVKSTDLAGFPAVNWTNHPGFEVNGMAAAPDGALYICNGPFTSHVYRYDPLSGATQDLCTSAVDLHGLGYGNDTLYGFANFASPMGIYSINPATGAAALVVNLAPSGRRFFGLDFNPADGLLYGYDEYGSPGGLCSIDPASGAIVPIAGMIPAENGQGRALAVGNGVVYVGATRGDEGIACYAWDLEAGGPWTPFTQPYPAHHNTGGAAFLGGEEAPQCLVEPAALELGAQLGGGLYTGQFTITNVGGGVLEGLAQGGGDCPNLSLLNPGYSLAAGESQVVSVMLTLDPLPGHFLCTVDPGSGCELLPLSADVVGVEIFHGEASACGLVEELGHLPGAFGGYMVDWNAGDVGLNLLNGAGHPLTVSLWINGQSRWSGTVNADQWAGQASGVNPAALGVDEELHFEVSDGGRTWNTGGEGCLWELRFAGLAAGDRPQGFRLDDPAPNPFNPVTTITVELAQAGELELRVLDLGGCEVAVLQRGALPAGRHEFRWEPGARPSGLYFVTARSAAGTQTRRVLFLK